MQFKQAFSLVSAIYKEIGGPEVWSQFREEFESGTRKHKTADEYLNRLNSRTDISQDDVWDIQCVDGGLQVLFALMYPDQVEAETTTSSEDTIQPPAQP